MFYKQKLNGFFHFHLFIYYFFLFIFYYNILQNLFRNSTSDLQRLEYDGELLMLDILLVFLNKKRYQNRNFVFIAVHLRLEDGFL